MSRLTANPLEGLSRKRRHPLAPFLLLLAALGLTGGLYTAFAPSPHADAAAGLATTAIDDGRAIYIKNCSTCHGPSGVEGSSDGPPLLGVGAAAVEFQVSTGRMPAARSDVQQGPRKQAQFSEQQIADLVAYVSSLTPGPAVPSGEDTSFSPEDAAEGGAIYRTNCAMCHNYAGKGGALSGGDAAPSLAGVSAKHIYEAMLTGPQSMPVFNDSTMVPANKRKIIAFLKTSGGEPAPGGASLGKIGPVSEGLFGWLVAMGLLIGCAVWLGAKAR